jgi:hypothetical protein
MFDWGIKCKSKFNTKGSEGAIVETIGCEMREKKSGIAKKVLTYSMRINSTSRFRSSIA